MPISYVQEGVVAGFCPSTSEAQGSARLLDVQFVRSAFIIFAKRGNNGASKFSQPYITDMASQQARASGYYWVKLSGEYFSGKWEVAEYRDWAENPWYLTGHNEGLSELAIAQVGYCLARPAEED